MSRRFWMFPLTWAVLFSLVAVATMSCCATDKRPTTMSPPALKDAFRGSFLVGAALNANQFTEHDARGAALVKTHFNSITPENVLKWALVHPQPDAYDFEAADRFVEFGEKHGMFIVGHTLVWHNQTPRSVFEDTDGNIVDRETLLRSMREHIHAVVGRYKGRIHAWDVVNEDLNENGTMRQSRWMKIIGEDYLARAFEYAREANPRTCAPDADSAGALYPVALLSLFAVAVGVNHQKDESEETEHEEDEHGGLLLPDLPHQLDYFLAHGSPTYTTGPRTKTGRRRSVWEAKARRLPAVATRRSRLAA